METVQKNKKARQQLGCDGRLRSKGISDVAFLFHQADFDGVARETGHVVQV